MVMFSAVGAALRQGGGRQVSGRADVQALTFAADPNPGLDHERFSGPAVVFISTVNYPTTRTAIVQ